MAKCIDEAAACGWSGLLEQLEVTEQIKEEEEEKEENSIENLQNSLSKKLLVQMTWRAVEESTKNECLR